MNNQIMQEFKIMYNCIEYDLGYFINNGMVIVDGENILIDEKFKMVGMMNNDNALTIWKLYMDCYDNRYVVSGSAKIPLKYFKKLELISK
jgi:hypothetical protein